MKLPKARTENLLEQNFEKETLIYDLLIDKAFNLNETLTIVYKACGQKLLFDELRQEYKFTDDFIYLALDELKRNDLLADDYDSPFKSTSRREVIKKVGLASMLALPLVTGLIAPKAASAASGSGSPSDSFLAAESVCYNQAGARQCGTGYCTGEASSSGYCCSPNVAGKRILLSGQTYSETNPSPRLFEINQVPSESACPVTCCNGTTPSGGCTYIPYQDQNEDPPPAGYERYTETCNCVC
jgi:hypothetical protein